MSETATLLALLQRHYIKTRPRPTGRHLWEAV